MTTQKYQLLMRSGPKPGEIFVLDKDEITIGREVYNDFPITEPEVSRKHTRIFQKGDVYFIEDLGSTNGTFLNNERLTSIQPLRVGDVIILGESIHLLFEESKQAVAETPVVAPVETPVQQVEPQPIINEPPAIEANLDRQIGYSEPPIPQEQVPLPPATPIEPSFENEPELRKKRKMPTWLIVLLILIIILCILPALILTFMPANWWCALFEFFNTQLPGCPIP